MGIIHSAQHAIRNFTNSLTPSSSDGQYFHGVYGKIDSPLGLHHHFDSRIPDLSLGPKPSSLAPGLPGTVPSSSSAQSYLNWTDGAGNPIGSGGGSGFPAASPVSDQYDYYNAKLASIYKMNAQTAYQEALSNTSYQRAVEDLKAAGLNPVLAAGKVSGADSFYGHLGSSGGSGGFSGGRSFSGASSGKSGLKAALKDYNVRSGVSSVVSGITMAATKNFQAGAAAYYFSNAILNAVAKR